METIEKYLLELEHMLGTLSMIQLQQALNVLEQAYYHEQRIFIMGNGGSAATASHFALDLAKNTIVPGAPRLKAISLTDHVPLITAWSNDTTYERVFSEQLANMIQPCDVIIAISTSGNSPNIINVLQLAKQWSATTIGLLGAKGGKAKEIADIYILAPGQNIEQEEDAHLILAHIITRHMRNIVRIYSQQLVHAGQIAQR